DRTHPLDVLQITNAARLEAGVGRISPFSDEGRKVRNRRVSLIPVRPDEGRLTEPTTAVQPCRREALFVPCSGRCRYQSRGLTKMDQARQPSSRTFDSPRPERVAPLSGYYRLRTLSLLNVFADFGAGARGYQTLCVDDPVEARAIWNVAPRSGAVMCPA